MIGAEKLMRTVRCSNDQVSGILGNLILAISNEGGTVGEVRLIQDGHRHVVRDITICADDEDRWIRAWLE